MIFGKVVQFLDIRRKKNALSTRKLDTTAFLGHYGSCFDAMY